MLVIAIAVVAVLLLVALPLVYVKNYIKVPPNEVAVFTGRGQPKVVRGGARFRMPGIERVDIMSLEPFNVSINLQNALSNNGVPVNVEAVGLVRIGSADEAVQTAVQRFLTSDLNELQRQINEILAGSLRGITATMTVEDLNSNRDTLARSVVDEAGGDLARIGMEVDVLKIAGISDRNGYLESLGQRRIAEVKRDAAVGTAEAERDAQIQSAKARQEGSIAQAQADTAIATANQKRDVELARLRAQTEAENAQADQAGPLANARAQKDVGIAVEQAEAARVQARIEVEQRRSEQAQAALQADVIAPAEAQRQADIARAEGQRQATILAGQAEADARKAAADALRVERQAEADGIKARLVAEAAGKKEIAAALNTYSPEAARLQTLPDVLASVVKATEAAATPLSEIERLSIIGGASDTQDAVGGLLGVSPLAVAKIVEALKASGIDLPAMLNRAPAVTTNGQPDSVGPATSS
ncbi:flotillin family protein [Mycolicibacterium litorale]|uniref:flotillin family protein n=1 Tax=Mycolicibacterium litorale TaxID=758802 RepID=UPI003CF983AD